MGQVIAVPTDQSEFFAIALGEHAEAVMLDLVNPTQPGRRCLGEPGKQGLKEVAGKRDRNKRIMRNDNPRSHGVDRGPALCRLRGLAPTRSCGLRRIVVRASQRLSSAGTLARAWRATAGVHGTLQHAHFGAPRQVQWRPASAAGGAACQRARRRRFIACPAALLVCHFWAKSVASRGETRSGTRS